MNCASVPVNQLKSELNIDFPSIYSVKSGLKHVVPGVSLLLEVSLLRKTAQVVKSLRYHSAGQKGTWLFKKQVVHCSFLAVFSNTSIVGK